MKLEGIFYLTIIIKNRLVCAPEVYIYVCRYILVVHGPRGVLS